MAAALYEKRAGVQPPPGALIDFRPSGTTPSLSFVDVLRMHFNKSVVRNQVVLIAPTAPALGDLQETALGGAVMSTAEIQANAINTAIDGFPLRTMSSAGRALLLLVLGCGGPLLLTLCYVPRLGSASLAAELLIGLVAWAAVAQILLQQRHSCRLRRRLHRSVYVVRRCFRCAKDTKAWPGTPTGRSDAR